jgi:glycosyltransferase involved in cell wall biosynthesis
MRELDAMSPESSLTIAPGTPASPETKTSVADLPVSRDMAVILPAYNEIDGIERTLTALRATLADLPCSSEIIVVDDGSTDGTGECAAACGARVISHGSNRGYGAALKTGILGTLAPVVTILDADCTYAPDAIPRLYAKLEHADMVVGARALSSKGVAWIRRPAKWVLNRFAGYLVGRRIPDLNSGQRVMKREALMCFLHLCPDGFSFTSTITLAMMANGRHVVYEPIEYATRSGESKIRPSHFGSFMLLVVRTIVLFNPLKVFLPVGLILFLIGVAKLVQDIPRWNLSETAVMAFLAAMVVWAVGLLADMIARLHMAPRQFP